MLTRDEFDKKYPFARNMDEKDLENFVKFIAISLITRNEEEGEGIPGLIKDALNIMRGIYK